jgi:hyaluronoglucosaminidase
MAAGVAVAVAALVAQASPGYAVTRAHHADVANDTPAASALPAVYPVPQSMTRHGAPVPVPHTVTVVAGATTDASALAAVDTVLKNAGATTIDTVSDATAPAPSALTVYVGGTDENAQTAAALGGLGIAGTSGLPAEGYVLGVGRERTGAVVVLDGVDATGTYYAAQTLRQLVARHGAIATIAGVAVRDWPSMPVRGVIEGFYGNPWSTADRLSQLDFYGEHKMNTYVYSPKDDPYLRAQWRDPYPADQLATIKELVDRAIADHVTFTYALSPGLSVCYSSAADEQALVNKFDSLWSIGVRSFAIPLDDISYTTWNCAADEAKFGTGGGAAGTAQAYLLNEVDKDFIATHPGAQPLEMVPTEYSDDASSPYKTAIANDLNADIIVEWTGIGVIPATITPAQATATATVYNHRILLWDNYPVNDYVNSTLLLGPYVGRDPGLDDALVGITANPMIQAEPSKIALFNVADFTWNSAAYNPTTSWNASLAEFGHEDPAVVAALRAFADVNYQSTRLNLPEAPVLSQEISDFWTSYNAGDPAAAVKLHAALTELRDAQAVLNAHLGDAAFLSEARPWLTSTTYWGEATLTALDMLVAQRQGDGARAWSDRLKLPALVQAAESQTYVTEGTTVTVQVGTGVLDDFVNEALNANAVWLHTDPHPVGQTSMVNYESYVPANMVDGDAGTFFWSDAAPAVGDYVGVDLGTVRPVTGIDVQMAKSSSPNDYIHDGEIEYSSDGTNWTSAGTFSDTTEVKASFPAGTSARYIRLVNEGTQIYWVVVDEFAVTTPPQPEVTGAPAAAAGSSLDAAADGDIDTAYAADGAPSPGDAITITLPAATTLNSVIVAQSGATPATATVLVESGGAWLALGHLTGGYTRLPAHGDTVEAIRLSWADGSAAPTINEVVPVAAS